MGNDKDINLGYKVYVPNLSENSITVIPAKKSGDTKTISLDKAPQFIGQVPGTKTVYTLLSGGNEITTINSENDTVNDTFRFEVGASAPQVNYRCLFTSDGSKAYFATSHQPAGVAVMKVADHTLIKGINVNSTSVRQFIFSAAMDKINCIDPDMGQIYIISVSSDGLLSTIKVPESFVYAELNTDSGNYFMAESGSSAAVKEFNPNTQEFVRRINDVTDSIVKLVLSEDKTKLYVLGSNELVIIDLTDDSIEDRINLDYSSPTDFQFLPDGKKLLIPSADSDLIMILDPYDYSTDDVIDTGDGPGEMIIFK